MNLFLACPSSVLPPSSSSSSSPSSLSFFLMHTYTDYLLIDIPTLLQSQSPTTRASRMFPVRRSTVVVHGGEELVIRKLVLAGILSAEKSYLDCLSVIKEVSTMITGWLKVMSGWLDVFGVSQGKVGQQSNCSIS